MKYRSRSFETTGHDALKYAADYADAISGRDVKLIQDCAIDPRPKEVRAAYELARMVLIEREKDADFSIRLPGH